MVHCPPVSPVQHNCPGGQHLPAHSGKPAGQAHVPPWQTPPVGQILPQSPQLFVSVAGLMQVPPQHSQPGGQAPPQPPQFASED